MIQMIAAASDPRPRLSLEETLDESSWREDFERSQVKPNQSERMFFRRSLFSGVSNLSTPVAALFPSSSVALARRAKSGLVGETLPNHSDNVTGGQGRDVKSVVETKRDTGGVIKNRTGPGSKIQKGQFLPFSHFLTDLHGREHDYLRISISERCKVCTANIMLILITIVLIMMTISMILFLWAAPSFHWGDRWSARHLSCIPVLSDCIVASSSIIIPTPLPYVTAEQCLTAN